MRVCHGVAGHIVEVDEAELQWKKPIDLVTQYALDRWDMAASDLIAISSGGGTVGPGLSADSLGEDRHVFVFLRSALDPRAEVTAETLSITAPHESGLNEDSAAVANSEDELLRLRAQCTDPAFQVFRGNIEEAHRWLLKSRPVNTLAGQAVARIEVQRLAAQAVVENLTSHRTTCTRSMALFLQKYSKVQEQFDQNLANVEPCMTTLASVSLHPAMRAPGRAVLADLVPRERIGHFTTNLQAERKRLAHRLEKLKKQDTLAQSLCEQVKDHMLQFSQELGVESIAEKIQGEHAHAELELLPQLRSLVPCEGAAPTSVLEEEKRSAGVLEGLAKVCRNISAQRLPELQARWDQRHAQFLQRLREVSYVQSKVRDVERQAALLEEEINVQRNYSQQLGHIKKMPRAYQKMLYEIARRRQFRDRYLAEQEQARLRLAKMAEEENCRRRVFLQRHGSHLPAELAHGLGSLVPAVTVEVAGFDAQLPDIDFDSMFDSSVGATDTSNAAGLLGQRVPATLSSPSRDEPRSSTSSCASSSLPPRVSRGIPRGAGRAAQPVQTPGLDRSMGDTLAGDSQGGSSGQTGTGSSGQAAACSQDGGASSQSLGAQGLSSSTGTAPAGVESSVESLGAACVGSNSGAGAKADELQEQNQELSAQVASLMEELAQLRAARPASGTSQPPATLE